MPAKTRREIEFGDFQTPLELARRVCAVLARRGVAPVAVLEPTCGVGTFLRAARGAFPSATLLGLEVDPVHVAAARRIPGARVERADFFTRDWAATLARLPEPVLVLGNPPWITSSALGRLGGSNLPPKENRERLPGLEALTGKSNFDVSEWMLRRLLEALAGRRAVLAMLCKSAVARKVLRHAWTHGLPLADAATFAIDAAAEFGASVDACLLVVELGQAPASRECAVHPDLEARAPASTLALRDGELVADLAAHAAFGHLAGRSSRRWRSGVKHDAARVMELRRVPGGFANGLGEVARLEESHVFPLLKGSDLARRQPAPTRHVLVPQRFVGEDTERLAEEAPLTAAYLAAHAARLDARASSVYRGRPRFSVFGVGPYAFTPWKVAVSGFHAPPAFRCVGPFEGRPVVLDDTAYFLPCASEAEARTLTDLLSSPAARGFFRAFLFPGKRPVTAGLLGSLDLERLTAELGVALPAGELDAEPPYRPGSASAGNRRESNPST